MLHIILISHTLSWCHFVELHSAERHSADRHSVERHSAECHSADHHYGESHSAECRGALQTSKEDSSSLSFSFSDCARKHFPGNHY